MDVQLNSLTALAAHLEIVSSSARRSHGWTYYDEVKMLRDAAAELKLLRDREANTMKLAEHVEALGLDKARLDWIDREHWMDGGEVIGGVRHMEVRFLVPGVAGDFQNGVRAAIDAGKKATP